MSRPGPDFFIVGAPKCGTTSLDAYLDEHPDVFMARKEQHFFGSDLAGDWPQPRPGAQAYFDSFRDSRSAPRRGDASVFYLWSRRAAEEIHEYQSDARIIVAFRNPVDVIPSLHSQYLHDSTEGLEDLRDALAAERVRRADTTPALDGGTPRRLWYRDVVRFDVQLERYFGVFGREQVHVVLFDDLIADPAATYRRMLEFLDLDPSFSPTRFHVVNANKRKRSRLLDRLSSKMTDPSSAIRRAGRRAIPVHGLRSAMYRKGAPALARLNTSVAPRQPMPPELRRSLATEFAPSISRLSELLGRDLSHWYADASANELVQLKPVGIAGAPHRGSPI
jgi:hypothetical protein